MELRRARKRSVIINLTSLIDVLFLLLIFFIVSTTFVSQPAISLQLPEARNAEAVRQSPIVVYMDESGAVFVNDEPIEPALLEQALINRLADQDEKAVVLKADSRVSHGAVIHVLDLIKGAGVKKLTVATEPEK
ncbi:MAG: biopolymer transporter ExbD [Candidatus Krumholzibacteria bacterium]|nr:biopolymer transporter ExbD [Candidatus Krumholzibacteria bacterium]MDH4335898.1 biopolymer transporter ExbD [Candidatus Krumholzibacteria bacterium]MDH5268526.1 biopolymer transporter ExbD [Candidatus Krumholzibacteria bacterium]